MEVRKTRRRGVAAVLSYAREERVTVSPKEDRVVASPKAGRGRVCSHCVKSMRKIGVVKPEDLPPDAEILDG